MNNPFAYQNDLSTLNQDFNSINDYYASTRAAAQSSAIGKKTQAAIKTAQDVAEKGKKISDSVEELIGAAAAKKLVSGVVKPGVQYAVKGAKALGRGVSNVVSRVRSAAGEGGEGEGGEAEEGAEGEEMEGFDEIRPGVFRAQNVARPIQQDGGGEEGIELQEGTNQGGAGQAIEDEGEGAEAEGEEEGDAEGEGADAEGEGLDEALDEGADAAADAVGEGAGEAIAGGVAEGAADVAAADWWNPVGWFAGLVAAGAGIASAVEAANEGGQIDKDKKAQQAIHPQYSPPPSFAGRYIVPVKNTLQAF